MMGAIGYVTEGACRPVEGRRATVDRVEILLGCEKDIEGLAWKLHGGLCYAADCAGVLCSVENKDMTGALCVLEQHLEYLKAVADSLVSLTRKGGDVI
jgi:hypothetical protein